MTKMVKVVGTLLASTMLAGVANMAHAADDLLDLVKSRGVLRVCQISYTPYNVKDPMTNQWSGINVDIVNDIAKQLNVKVENIDATFATVIPSLQANKCDISAGATYIDPVRAQQVLFTIPNAEDSKTLVVPKNSKATTIADVDKDGTVISVRAGSGEEKLARKLFTHATVRPTTSDAAQPHLMEVATGRANAAIAGYTGAFMFEKANPNLNLKLIDSIKLEPTPFALMVPLGQVKFQQYVNGVIQQLKTSGELAKIDAHYMPKNVN